MKGLINVKKYVYSFKEGNKSMVNTLGGKGANLAEMTKLGLPVPSGFTVTTEACNKYYEDNEKIDKSIVKEIFSKLKKLEKLSGKKFGDLNNPLLVSVRSGARASMPGMMDTILNLGLNDEVCENFSKITNNERFVYDSYRRFIQMFADVVKNYPKSSFEGLFETYKIQNNIKEDMDLTSEDLKKIVVLYKEEYKKYANNEFPSDPKEQLIEAIQAVFRSWNTKRAITYRRLNNIPASWGTAVNVQEMVYGNLGNASGTGVAFTRNPATGEKKLFGEYLMNAQGEDVVAGIRTPKPIETLKEVLPKCYEDFVKICNILENHYKDMQDMEFTIENKKLFILQTRNGKRTAEAALNIAYDLEKEGMITKKEALLKVDASTLDQLLHPSFSKDALLNATKISSGLAASPGAGFGKICFTAEDAINAKNNGEKDIILVRLETSPEDIEGMIASNAVVTLRGGMTSHAAVVARGMGVCCVSGCKDLVIDEENKTLTTSDGKVYKEFDSISVDGGTGIIYDGILETSDSNENKRLEEFLSWADEVRTLKIRANADNKKDALVAKSFGAEGIGLCRTEHMFFEETRIFNFRKMIMADTLEKREDAISKILPYQQSDFEDLFEVMDGYGVTIRYLDPPLHEFLPKEESEIKKLAESLNMEYNSLLNRIESLKEFNPMMGHRGVRLAITYPEIAKMQTEAVINAAINVSKKGIKVNPEIMIPLIGEVKELEYVKEIVIKTADELIKNANSNIKYSVGTMIEVPRAALTADKIAKEAEFFSFGTNDLTQMTYGFSRDDATKFLDDYYKKQILEFDPFASIDENGVGELMKIAIEKAKKVRPDIKLGICGEHGGDPKSISFCHELGIDYVSCSPYRVPIAKLAAAKATIKLEIISKK